MTALILIFFFLSLSSVALGQTIQFCPGEDTPIAFNPVTQIYEEGASFDPLICAEEPCIELLHNIFEPLISISNTQAIEPELATEWKRLNEVTFRFALRQGVVFHNGEPFDAEAVHFSLMRASQIYGATAWFPEIARSVDNQVPPQIENIIAVSLGQIGLTVEFRRATESEFLREVYLPKFSTFSPPSFDILLLSVPVGTIFHAGMVPMTLLYSKEPNESMLRDPYLDQLYEEALRTYDPAKASALWKKLEQYVYDNHLLLIGYQERAVFGANKRLHFTPRTLMTFWDAYYE